MILFIRIFVLLILFYLPAHVSAEVKNRVLFLGDSLTEGFGLNPSQSYPQLLQKNYKKMAFQLKLLTQALVVLLRPAQFLDCDGCYKQNLLIWF